MTPLVIDVRSAQDARDVVHHAVQALAEGKLVCFPTETVYGLAASALDERAVLRLLGIKQRRVDQALDVAQLGAGFLDGCLEMGESLEHVLCQQVNRSIWLAGGGQSDSLRIKPARGL